MFPTGLGIGATHAKCDVLSPTRAAGIPPMITVVDPKEIIPGPPGTQPASRQGAERSVTRAAGLPPIKTVGHPLTIAKGMAGWGVGVGTGAAGCIGAWQWGDICRTWSPILAAGGMLPLLSFRRFHR